MSKHPTETTDDILSSVASAVGKAPTPVVKAAKGIDVMLALVTLAKHDDKATAEMLDKGFENAKALYEKLVGGPDEKPDLDRIAEYYATVAALAVTAGSAADDLIGTVAAKAKVHRDEK